MFDILDVDTVVMVALDVGEPSIPEIGSIPEKPKFRSSRLCEFPSAVNIPPIDSDVFAEVLDDFPSAEVLDNCPLVSTAELLGIDTEECSENDSEEGYMMEKNATVPFDLELLESTRSVSTECSRGTAK